MSNFVILLQYKKILTLFVINICIIYSFPDKTLTTALVKEFTSPKPTTIFRRINVEPDAFIASNKSLHVIRVDGRRHEKGKEMVKLIYSYHNVLLPPRWSRGYPT